jgi:ABC-type multidrug transport system fused ATPase/permease subunit
MDPAKPRAYVTPVRTVSLRIWRQFLGLNPFKGLYFGLFTTLHRTSDKFVAGAGAVFAVAAGIPLPIIGVIYGKVISGFPPPEDEMRVRIEQLLGVAVASFVVTSTYAIAFGRTGEKIAIGLRMKLLSKLLQVDQAYLDTHDTDPTALLGEKIDTILVGCSEKVGIFIQSMSYFVAAFTAGFILNAKLTGILFAAVLPAMTIIVYFGSTATSELTKAASQHAEYANAILESALRAVRLVQAFDMMTRICGSHRTHLKQSSAVGLRKAIVAGAQFGMTYFTAYAANALAFYVGSRMAASRDSNTDTGTIYAVVFLILDSSFVVGQFAPFLEIFARAAAAYSSIQEILESPSMSDDPNDDPSTYDQLDFAKTDLRFEDVSFCYPARPTVQTLNSLSLTVRAGAFNVIVGTSGGGKSTLVSLLLRMYDYSGRIMVGAQELRSLHTGLVRSQIAVLDQDCVLLDGTIYENVCHGLVGRDLSESTRALLCKQAAMAAGLDFLELLPNGIHTSIDSTLRLSGGQRQRVCLARALIKNPALLILDEPTSALDAHSELKVVQAVKAAVAGGTTVLMIAHRLSTVVEADHVAVVNDGRVVEEGTPVDLSKDGTIFRGLLDAQNMQLVATQPTAKSHSGTLEIGAMSDSNKFEVEHTKMTDSNGGNSSNQPTLRQLATTFLRLSKPEHLLIIIGLISSTISGCIILGEAIVFGNLIQLLNTGRSDLNFQNEANFYCLMFFVVALVALASYMTSGVAFGIASNRLTTRVQATLLEWILHLDIAWFSAPGRSVHELTSSLSKDSGDLACLSGIALGTIFTIVVSVFGGIILAHVIACKIAVVLLATVPVVLASGYIRLRLLAKTETRQRTAYHEATAGAIESCRSRRTITALGLEDFCLARYREALHAPYKAGLTSSAFCNTLLAFSLTVTYFVYALAYWW